MINPIIDHTGLFKGYIKKTMQVMTGIFRNTNDLIGLCRDGLHIFFCQLNGLRVMALRIGFINKIMDGDDQFPGIRADDDPDKADGKYRSC